MSFLVVLIGVIVDRLLPWLDGYRNDAWFEVIYQPLARYHARNSGWPALLFSAVAVIAPAAVAWAALWLLWQITPFLAYVLGFALFVFALGPRGLFTDLYAYADAVRSGDTLARDRIAAAVMAPHLPAAVGEEQVRAVITRLLVLAGRRLFGVIFWYVLLGPSGAVLFRAADLLRHRAAATPVVDAAARQLYGVLEWAPSRLLAGTYALAGSFDEAMAERRAYYAECQGRFFEINEDILACTGRGALAFDSDGGGLDEIEAAGNLVFRALVIWLAVLALLSLLGWS